MKIAEFDTDLTANVYIWKDNANKRQGTASDMIHAVAAVVESIWERLQAL